MGKPAASSVFAAGSGRFAPHGEGRIAPPPVRSAGLDCHGSANPTGTCACEGSR